jgi:predicted RNA-binding protein associated with RNAse of E/G family
MDLVHVHKLDTQGRVAVNYQALVAEWLSDGVRLEARWTRPPLPLGYTTFETGDRFVEWFFTNRWYNIFEIHASDDTLKGWYCNVAEPATIAGDVIACRDLLLDVWVTPHGAAHVLDEEEFAADTTLDEPARHRARVALDELLRLIDKRQGPFARIAAP